ncbi:hypothetical protein BDC45DRAFT_590580 [Circinella umbellata]|nr:hypothetical protein BDC45DRAFT_590580 [Circinella umbellata]
MFARRIQTKQEQKIDGDPISYQWKSLPNWRTIQRYNYKVALENSNEPSKNTIMKNDSHPKRINKSLYRELQKKKVRAKNVINTIYKTTETTICQAKAAIEIYEHLTQVMDLIEDGQDQHHSSRDVLRVMNSCNNIIKPPLQEIYYKEAPTIVEDEDMDSSSTEARIAIAKKAVENGFFLSLKLVWMFLQVEIYSDADVFYSEHQ